MTTLLQLGVYIFLNTFLHLTHIYANSFTSVFTYLKMTEDGSKRRFLSMIFTVLSFKKPLLIRIFRFANKLHKSDSEATHPVNA